MSHIILSLAYSVYIASTVIFLQVQATPKDQLAIWRLKYCLRRLDEIRNFSPGKIYRLLYFMSQFLLIFF